ncbi:carbohydrate-binding CenC domain protein [Psychromonas ingrahamii 37]|uniref:Carbohydrate-binding CenC domain protein n=1 Tax=Psychromonas ingrahamii (strain DSM 17664 / CCUG 51855 / 37) TaxID=357804 RepID=A1SSE4_PSYIN|nr:carbohydrate-binding CenC domain-containing protein [Psychromonas ingrahamii]ABM02409.1 carbohydrate-binding CenC domain protein [Psychromonas ingrahamii 37]
MKVIKGFKLANVVLASAMALALAGCNGDDLLSHKPDAPAAPKDTTDLSGKAADGYLSGAIVCLDVNDDKICGIDEPTATTSAGGGFSITGVAQSLIDAHPLLVQITADTIDEDYPEKTLTPYTLSAPVGFTFVSPITTMIQNAIESDSSISAKDAEDLVKAQLGTTLDLSQDYIAGKSDSANQAEFEKLHKVAQVVARIIAAKVDQFNGAATAFTAKEISTAIMAEVFKATGGIAGQVDAAIEAGSAFDPDTIATEIGDKIVVAVKSDAKEYVLISSTGTASEINDATVVGEWSTGSVINAAGNYDGLDAWTVTSGAGGDNNWGTVLALSDGFVGDFSAFDKLTLKIATSGGYADGYFIKIGAGGVETEIPLSVTDGSTSWQDVEVDLANYDLSSIEYIAVFAKTGTAGVSKIHIADLALGQQPDAVPDTVIQEYTLISSAGTASEINANTEVGEWSTGSVINAEASYEGLNAWSVTSGAGGDNNWGTVLALTGGFVGDFTAFDKLKLKVATSGGYADGYFIKIGAGGVETEIPLSVSDGTTGWQDVEVNLATYDLSSIEFIAIFAKTGTAGVSQIHIADLSLVQLADTGTSTEDAALEVQKTAAAILVDTSYTTSTWATLTTALAMPETTQAEVTAKTEAITTATAGLEQKAPVGVDKTSLSAAITASEGDNLRQTGIGEAEGQASQTDWQAFYDAILAAGVIRDAAADQAAVDQAVSDLAAAQVVFNGAKVGTIIDQVVDSSPRAPVFTVFNDQINPKWAAWGCCDNASTQHIYDASDAYANVTQFSIFGEAVAGFTSRSNAQDPSHTAVDGIPFDASAIAATGTIEFDLKMTTPADAGDTTWKFKVESSGGGAIELDLANAPTAEWQHYSFSLAGLGTVNTSAIDLLMVFPAWGTGTGAVYSVDNVQFFDAPAAGDRTPGASGDSATTTVAAGIDFEGSQLTWESFDTAALQFVANPDSSGTNSSATVAKLTNLTSDGEWVGAFTRGGLETFTLDASNNVVKIWVYKNTISPVHIKFEKQHGDGWGAHPSRSVSNTLINQWEELTIDFAADIGLPENDAIGGFVVMPDVTNARSEESVIYFDNISFSGDGDSTNSVDPVGSVVEEGVALVTDGGFESATLGDWADESQNSAIAQVSSEDSQSGTYSAKLSADTAQVAMIRLIDPAPGTVVAGQSVIVSFDLKGSIDGPGGVFFAELMSNLAGDGTSKSELLSGGPLFPNATWTNYRYETTLGNDVDGGLSLLLKADPGAAVNITAYIDNIVINALAAVDAPVELTAAAPAPTASAADVISIFSDSYTSVAGVNTNPDWGQSTVTTEVDIAGNNTLKMAALTYQGLDLSAQDLSSKTYLHLDYWTADATGFDVYLIGGGETAHAITPVTGSWQSIEIPLSVYTGVNLTAVNQFKFDAQAYDTSATIHFDNMYFY